MDDLTITSITHNDKMYVSADDVLEWLTGNAIHFPRVKVKWLRDQWKAKMAAQLEAERA